MINQRDEQIIDCVKTFGVMYADQIARVFMKGKKEALRIAQRRLKAIIEANELKVGRDKYSNKYIYFDKTPNSQLKHKLLIAECYAQLHTIDGNLVEFIPEYSIDNIRADAFFIFESRENRYYNFLEVQISNTPVDIAKYERLCTKGFPWPVFPRIIVVSNKKITVNTNLTVKAIGTDYKGFGDLFK